MLHNLLEFLSCPVLHRLFLDDFMTLHFPIELTRKIIFWQAYSPPSNKAIRSDKDTSRLLHTTNL